MQTLGAYLIFLLVVAAVGLATVVAAIAGLAISVGIASVKDSPGFRRWERTAIETLIPIGVRIEQQFRSLHRPVRTQVVETSQWRAQ